MKLTLKDGQVIERPFAAGAQGFVATKIEISPDDIRAMRDMAQRDFSTFYAHMSQLEMRFPERRVGFHDPDLAAKITDDGHAALKIAMSSAYGKLGSAFPGDPVEPGEKAIEPGSFITAKLNPMSREISDVIVFSPNDAHQAYVDFMTPSPEVLAVQAGFDEIAARDATYNLGDVPEDQLLIRERLLRLSLNSQYGKNPPVERERASAIYHELGAIVRERRKRKSAAS